MKKIFLFLFCFVPALVVFATGDSTRVSFCTTTGDDCYGKPTYSQTVDIIDSAGKVVRSDDYSMAGCWEGYIDSIFRKSASNIYEYDVSGNLIHHIQTIYILSDSVQNDYTYTYDSLGHLLTRSGLRIYPLPLYSFLYREFEYSGDSIISDLYMDNHGTGIDTAYYRTFTYDSLMRRYVDSYRWYYGPSGTLSSFYNQVYNYDTTGKLISLSVLNQLAPFTATRLLFFYNSFDSISVKYEEGFDSLSMSWIRRSKVEYVYDNFNYLERSYSIGCSTPACTDTMSYIDYTVDASGRITHESSYNFDGDWNSSFSVQYDSYGDTILYGNGSSTENGCGESEYTYTYYNSSRQIVHTHMQTLAACAMRYVDCDYYNLNADSMVLFVSSPVTACALDSVYPVVFHAGGAGPLQYHWSPGIYFSDSTIKYPCIVNNVPGIYSLTVTDSLGRSITDTVSVQLHPNLIHPLDISAYGNPPCAGVVQLTFSPDSLSGSWYWYWEFDGSTYSQDTIVAGYSGLYSLVVFNNYCTYRTDTDLVLLEPQPLTINTIGSYRVCEGNTVTLFTQDQFNFTWNTGSSADTIVADTTGYYYISMTDINSCPDTSNKIYVYIGSFESQQLIRDTAFCSGDSIRVNPGFYYSYLWNDSSTLNHLVITDPGVYSLRVTDYFGCPNHDTITVTENLLPVLDLGEDTLLCRNTSLTLSPGNFQDYLWQDGTGDSVFTALYSGADTLLISVIVTDSLNCVASDTINIFYDVCNEIDYTSGRSTKVWPKPADDKMFFQSPDSKFELFIYNSLGETVYSGVLLNSAGISCQSWPSGSYYYKVIKEDGYNSSGKIIILHP